MRNSCIAILSGLSLAMGLALMVPMPAHAQAGTDLLERNLPPPAPLGIRGVVLMTPQAQLGDAAEQTELGSAFLGRDAVKANYPLAVAWLKKAAEQDYDYAQTQLGQIYLAGTGVARDPALAAEWFGKAAVQGHSYAQYQLGKLFQDGQGVPQSDVQAYVWFELAARSPHGDTKARDAVAARMTPDQLTQARTQVEAWQPAPLTQARQVTAAENLYNRGKAAEAYDALTPLAEAGNAHAQFLLARICEYGDGTIKNEAAAAVWYEKAARQGHPGAQSGLGEMYAEGRGVRKDYKAAEAWLGKASDQNIAEAQVSLGLRYMQGKGVKKNTTSAVSFFQKAATQGNDVGLLFLGMMTFYGDGTTKNPVEGYKWVRLAETYARYDSGRETAKARRQEFARTMMPADVARAESLAKAWSPTIPMP